MQRKLIPLAVLCFLFSTNLAQAELLKYVDASGATHYVDSIEKVPEDYKSQVKDLSNTPGISKVSPGRKKLYEKSKYKKSNIAKSQKKLEIFVANWCGYCKALEKDLVASNIRYTRYDVEKSAVGAKMWKKHGGGVPFSRIGGKTIIRGYAPDEIKSAIYN